MHIFFLFTTYPIQDIAAHAVVLLLPFSFVNGDLTNAKFVCGMKLLHVTNYVSLQM